MIAKDKTKKHIKITIKKIIILFTSVIIILYGIIIYNHYFQKNEVYAKENNIVKTDEFKLSKAKEIDIDYIIENNTKSIKNEDFIVEETILEYITKYNTNSELPKGVIQVIQEGREGKQEITKKRIYENGEIISENQINSKVTIAAVDKIVEIGTGKYTSTYKIKVGDIVYVTSDRLSVMIEPNDNSERLATLRKKQELKVIEIKNDWYKIYTEGITGYVKKDNVTHTNISSEYEENKNESKPNNSSKLSFDMALNKPSGLSIEQFKKILTDSKDKNKIFENNAEYFYYIEKQYNINGIFVASVGIHESNWGTSKIAREKNNLFGYGAYDSNPYNGAYSFSNYSESIDLLARVFVKYYINPKGTSIYGSEKALGTYYNGATLSGVNKKYATDKNWANGVYNFMKYLYNKL